MNSAIRIVLMMRKRSYLWMMRYVIPSLQAYYLCFEGDNEY